MTQERQIKAIVKSEPATDGDGVSIQRLAMMGAPETDPFLLLDELKGEFSRELGGGFPPHPHRGMQTLTYLLKGGIVHEDSDGNVGELNGGGAQWMSAGSGIIHSEMPPEGAEGEFHGFQLWINLPASEKMKPSRYRDVSLEDMESVTTGGSSLTAISGTWQLDGQVTIGPLKELAVQGSLADMVMGKDAELTLILESDQTCVCYLFEGSLEASQGRIPAGHLVLTTPGDQWSIRAGSEGARLLLLKGDPIGEPVAAYGPFVMNTEAEIQQAIQDYQNGDLVLPAAVGTS